MIAHKEKNYIYLLNLARNFVRGKWVILTFIGSLLFLSTSVKAVSPNNILSNYSNYKTFSTLENITPDKKITILFSRPLNQTSINNSTIELINASTGENVPITINLIEEKKVEISHDQLEYGQSYYLIVHNNITDTQHKTMKNGIICLITVMSHDILSAPSTSKLVQNSNSSNVSGSALVSYAMKFLGTPYVWGGTTPIPGFDCSGYMQYVYAHFGISIDRTTFNQIHDGVEVSKDNLQPGDLVFFGTWDNPCHVGMYVGNNCYIHAPHTGDVIEISELSRSDFLTARRVR